MIDHAGRQIGNYRIIRLLGTGGFADVYLGEHRYLNIQVALKFLHIRISPTAVEDILTEARHLSQLIHPHIIRLLDFGIENDTPFLVMDYAPGGTLRERHPKGIVPLSDVITYVQGIASALQYTHENGLIHRDLKPENLLFGRNGEILLSDFGIALLSSSSGSEPIPQMFGSLAYMAPEQIRGTPQPASDQYALAMLVYEWLSGDLPFHGSTSEIRDQQLYSTPLPIHQKNPMISPEIEQAVLQALSKDPASRFPDVQSFAETFVKSSTTQPQYIYIQSESAPKRTNQTSSPYLRFKNLPSWLIPLIGREQEKGEICEILAQPEVRLLTLTGTGGIGKTRLASQVGSDLQDEFAHGICFVQLAPILNPDLILPTIAHTLGLQENDDQPQMTRLISFLRDKHMLLLLDNFEQVLPAAPLLSHLLSFCPRLKFLVTSRAKLHIQDEYVFPVKPLALPDITNDFSVDAIAQYPAITLFTKRTQAIYPEFQLNENNAQSVAEICRLLDGLPLAIELAAARIKLLTPQKLYSRLKQHQLTMLVGGKQDVPLRQQTLKNTLQWSYTLLTGEEQILFQRCCVFVKSFTLEAIEFVCNSIGDLRTPVIDLVASLIDKSLILQLEITRDEQRLYLLSLIREFGMEMLRSSEEWDKMRAAHATYYLNLANEARQGLVGSEQAHWLELLKPELENIRAALLFLQENGEIEAALQLAASLQLFWMQSGYMSEGRHFLEHLVVISRERKAPVAISVVTQALYIISWLAYWQNDLEQAETFLAECEESGRSLGDKKSIADALHYQGNIAFDRGDIGKAIAKHEESLELYRESGDRKGTAKILLAMGTHALYSSDYPRAKALCQESFELVRDTGDSWQMAVNLQYLGWASYELGEYEAARVLSEESMAIFGTLGQSSFAVDAHIVLASIARIFEEQERAHALLQEALALSREMKSNEDTGRVLCRSGQLFLREGNLETAQSLFDESVNLLNASWKISRNKWAMAASLEGLGEIVLAQGQPAWTVQLFASAEAVRAANGYHTSLGIEQPFYDQTLAQARASIDKVSFDALWTRGQSMAPEQVLRLEIRERDLQSHTTTTPVSTNEQTSFAHLTRRELEVLKLLAQGMTNAQIAESLTISLSTVDTHLRSIYNKLGVSSRVQAARYSIMHQLLS